MRKNLDSFTIITVFLAPFFIGVLLLVLALITLNDIELSPFGSVPFSFLRVLVFFAIHTTVLIFLLKGRYKHFFRSELSPKKVIALMSLILFLSSFILEMGFKMNANYWFRSREIEKLEITVEKKNISTGRATDYYIRFSSNGAKYSSKVSLKSYNACRVGQTYVVLVNKGFFDGYFLTEKIDFYKTNQS